MDISFLAPLYNASGPFVSVYMETTRTSENADHEIALRWRALREELQQRGADHATLDALDGVVGQEMGYPGRHGQAIIASHGRVLLHRVLPEPPRRDTADWLALPDPLPILAAFRDVVPYVLVIADRVGADIHAYGVHGHEIADEDVEGGTFHLRKVKPGDWAHKQYQRRAENLWSENAETVADEVNRLVRRLHSDLLLVAGDPRAREKLQHHLDPPSKKRLVMLEAGGRAPGAATDKLDQQVRHTVAEAAAARNDGTFALLREQLASALAVAGLDPTLDELRLGRAGTLYLPTDGRLSTGTLWADPNQPANLRTSKEAFNDNATAEPQQVPAAPALIRAAQTTDADAEPLHPDTAKNLPDRVACLRRW